MEQVFVQKYGKHVIRPEDIRLDKMFTKGDLRPVRDSGGEKYRQNGKTPCKSILKPYRLNRHRTDAYKELSNQSDTGKGTEVVENTGKNKL